MLIKDLKSKEAPFGHLGIPGKFVALLIGLAWMRITGG
jgi:hypothetical protein